MPPVSARQLLLFSLQAPLHGFATCILTGAELTDGLVFAVASLVIWPQLPDRYTLKARSIARSGRSGGLTLGGFAARLLVIVIIAALAAALWQLSDSLVLLFGAVLLASGLCAATRLLTQHTGIHRSFAASGRKRPKGFAFSLR
mgnify:FL=1